MKIRRLLRRLAVMGAVTAFCACESARQVPFNEADFKWARAGGSGVVKGRAYIEMRDKSINVGSNSYVALYPATPYTTEYITRQYVHGVELAPADPRMESYVQRTRTDDDGNFIFRNVSPGEYYVATRVHWISRYLFPDAENNLQWNTDHHAQFIYKRVTIRNAQTMNVTDWNQVADWNLDTVLH